MPTRRHLMFALALLLPAAPALAHKAHVHGVMALNLVIEGPVLAVQLETPQDSLVGHERRPRPGAEAAAAAAALATLRDAGRWLRPDPAAGCTAGPVELEPGRLEGAPAAGESDSGHADVAARVEWRCRDMGALRGLDVLLFQHFARTERIEVQVAGASGPARQMLRKTRPRVVLVR